MQELRGDLWDLHKHMPFSVVCITTNGYIKTNGEAVMGRGCALQAKQKYPEIPWVLGQKLMTDGNHVHQLISCLLFSFPVKYKWNESADINLIERSAHELMVFVENLPLDYLLPKPGCGNGGLDWEDVKKVISPILKNDRVFIIDYAEPNYK